MGNLVLLFLSPSRSPPPPTPLPFCVSPLESGAATRVEPPLPLTPQELTGDVIRDPRWERKRQTPRWRQRRFLSFVKTVISFLRPRAKVSHRQTIYTFRFY